MRANEVSGVSGTRKYVGNINQMFGLKKVRTAATAIGGCALLRAPVKLRGGDRTPEQQGER